MTPREQAEKIVKAWTSDAPSINTLNDLIDAITTALTAERAKVERLREAVSTLRCAFPHDLDDIDDDNFSGKRKVAASFAITIADLRRIDTALKETT